MEGEVQVYLRDGDGDILVSRESEDNPSKRVRDDDGSVVQQNRLDSTQHKIW